MAEVLAAHHISVGNEGGWYCSNFECGSFASFQEATKHQAAMLAAAGFGPVKVAKVEALERDPRVVAVAEKLALAYPYGFEYVKSGPSGADYHAAIIAVKTLDEMSEYEYAVVHTYFLEDRDTSEPRDWADKATAERWLKDHEESYAESRGRGEEVYFETRIVKRRKAGKVEEL